MAFERTSPQTEFAGDSANWFAEVSDEVSTLLSMLQRELETKELEIERLHKIIDQEQQLRMIEAQKIQLLSMASDSDAGSAKISLGKRLKVLFRGKL